MVASTAIINAVTALVEEIRRVLREELREVEDNLTGRIAHLEDLVCQLQVLPQPGPQPPGQQQPVPQPPGQQQPQNNNRPWTDLEVRALINLRVQHPFGNPGQIWGDISVAMKRLAFVRTRTACSKKWYSLVEQYLRLIDNETEIVSNTCFYRIHRFLNPIPEVDASHDFEPV
ncbi:hypothetical protein K1719_010631 [Acacia pycnantha]|nr:hypothetical protein K1719_010631 [Acacia pycnantha]